jgi:hypothetical protein
LGKIGGKWAVRVFRGQQILTTEIIGDLDPNIMVTVVQSAISLPSYSPYHIVRAVSPLIREAKGGYVPPAPGKGELAEVAPRPAVNSSSGGSESLPASSLQGGFQRAEEPTIQYENRQDLTQSIPKAPLKAAPPLEALRVEKPKVQKRLVLEPIKPEELVEKTFSSLMSYLGLALSYIYNNYGEKSAARMWQYLEEVSELAEEKRKGESFEDFIRRRVEEDMILGIEHNVVEFYDDKFVSRVRNCGFRENVAELEKSVTHFQQDLPCLLCQSVWSGSSRGIGFQFQLAKQKDGCEIVVEKPEANR